MAAPTYGVAGTYRQGSTATPAFAAPASIVSTSIVIIDFYLDAGATISSLPAGFAHVAGSPLTINPSGGGEHKICRIWARNPAGATYTVNLSANVYTNGQAHRADGCVATGDPWDTNSGTGTAVATATDITSGATPAVSMTTQNADQLNWFSGSNWGGGAWTPISGGTERMDTGDATLTVDTKTQAVAGGTGSLTATCASSDRRGALLGSLLSVALSSGDATVTASVVAATATVGAPSLRADQTVTAVKVSATATVGAPTITLSVVITPGVVAAVATVGTPTLSTGETVVAPATVAAVATVGAPTLSTGEVVTAVTVAAVATVGTVSVSSGGSVNITASVVSAVATAGAPALSTGERVAPATVAAVTTVGAPTITLSVAITPARVAATATVGTVAVTTTTAALITAVRVLAVASVGAPTITTGGGTSLAGNAHGPLPLAVGSITVHTVSIAGAVT